MVELLPKHNAPLQGMTVFREAAVVDLESGLTKRQVFVLLLNRLAHLGAFPAEAATPLLDELLAKERRGTCALGNGLALPHARTHWVDAFSGAVGAAPGGLSFDSLDGRPTRLVILLLSPFEQRQQHTEMMGHLAALLHDHTLPYWLQGSWRPRELLDYLEL